MLSLGQELKKAREERGIMLSDIAGATHISLRFLQAIENDSYDVLPGGVFNRAFVRKFARTVGFDEEQAVKLYEEQLVEMGGEPQRRYYTGVEEIEPSSSSGNGLVLSFLALVILAGGAYFAYLFFNTPSQSAENTVVANPTPAPQIISTPLPAATPMPSPTPEPKAELNMEVIAGNDQCWIQIITDDRAPDQGLLEVGDVREYKASEKIIIVSMGNTPALKITVNGRQLDPAKLVRSPRSVITQNVILTRENYQSYVQ